MNLPQVIILNGTGSSGKTSVAKYLQESLPFQYLNFSIDSVLYALPPTDLEAMIAGKEISRAGYHYPTLVAGYSNALAGLLEAGCHLIIDNAWIDDQEKLELLERLTRFDVCLVGVKCDLDIAEKREKERGDRAIGLARSEFPLVHKHLEYDICIDTSLSSEAAAELLLKQLDKPKLYSGLTTSIEQLRAQLLVPVHNSPA